MSTKQGKYTDEYKAGVWDRLYEPGASLDKVSNELVLTPAQLRIWRLEREAACSAEAKRRQQADATELTRLRKENNRLQEENEILQKGSVFLRAG